MSPLGYRTRLAEEDLGVPRQSRHLYRLSVTMSAGRGVENGQNHGQQNHFLSSSGAVVFPVNAPSLNVVSEGMLFDGLKGFDIEAVGKRV
jgi:hypothetical protein